MTRLPTAALSCISIARAEPPDELGARLLELRGALLHQALELVAAVGEREVQCARAPCSTGALIGLVM